jgi:hypothetical protein
MTIEEMIAYLKTWAKINRQEVYGSPADYVDADRLLAELANLERA